MKPFTRVLLVMGLAALALFAIREAPRDVTLVYGVPEAGDPQALEVDIRRGEETVRHAEFRFHGPAPTQVRHEVRLLDGEYTLALRLSRAAAPPRLFRRSISISEGGTIVVPLSGEP